MIFCPIFFCLILIFISDRENDIFIIRLFSKGFFIDLRCHINIMAGIVLCDNSDFHLIFSVVFFECQFVSDLKLQKACCFFTDCRPIICQFVFFLCNAVSKCNILFEVLKIFRNITHIHLNLTFHSVL